MFDLRYHVASLAAVFLALVIGILVGVGIASHGLGDSERRPPRRRSRLSETALDRRRAAGRRAHAGRARRRGATSRRRTRRRWRTRLEGQARRVAVRRLRSTASMRPRGRRALARRGRRGAAPRVVRCSVPDDATALEQRARPSARRSPQYAGRRPARRARAARSAQEFVAGGDDAALERARRTQLVEEAVGLGEAPRDAVVRRPHRRSRSAARPRTFLAGLYTRARGAGVPAVGVERRRDDAVGDRARLTERGLSTVDDVDTPIGRLALRAPARGGADGQLRRQGTAEAALRRRSLPVAGAEWLTR